MNTSVFVRRRMPIWVRSALQVKVMIITNDNYTLAINPKKAQIRKEI